MRASLPAYAVMVALTVVAGAFAIRALIAPTVYAAENIGLIGRGECCRAKSALVERFASAAEAYASGDRALGNERTIEALAHGGYRCEWDRAAEPPQLECRDAAR